MQGLIVVGTGIQAVGQLTIEARSAIERAATVFFLVADPLARIYLERLNNNLQSLHECYATDKPRMESYLEMVELIVAEVKKGKLVCVALYGHPGVFAFPAHVAVRRLRDEGIYAKMLPGVSAEDCLFADLGIDPAMAGCQSFEATDFLLFQRVFDPRSSLILWQVGVIGDASFQAGGYEYQRGITILVERLNAYYNKVHKMIVYEASHYPIYECRHEIVELAHLSDVKLTAESTLYIPPATVSEPNPEMLARLGLSESAIRRVEVRLNTSL